MKISDDPLSIDGLTRQLKFQFQSIVIHINTVVVAFSITLVHNLEIEPNALGTIDDFWILLRVGPTRYLAYEKAHDSTKLLPDPGL